MATKLAIVGFGTVGGWVIEKAKQTTDMEVSGIVSRRTKEQLEKQLETMVCPKKIDYPVVSDINELDADVAVLATESEALFKVAPDILKSGYNTVDSFDMHSLSSPADSRVPEYYRLIDEAAKIGKCVSIYGAGWDSGIFSKLRLIFAEYFPGAVIEYGYGNDLPNGGVSRGHSAKINRTVPGVDLACSRTFPKKDGKNVRKVYISLKPGTTKEEVTSKLLEHLYHKNDINEFIFTTREEVEKQFTEEHSGYIRVKGKTMGGIQEMAEFKLILPSNPAFTAQALVLAARECDKMLKLYGPGAYDVTDVPDKFCASIIGEEIRRRVI